MTLSIPRAWFYALFTLSGFAGLIYESIWSHYLKLFLGHAAYAQTLVLAIFMGGMALGSWLCSRYSMRWRNLLVGYAAAEAVIGACALVFHGAFVSASGIAYDSIMPAIGSPLAVTAFKWSLSTLLILPQSVLLGMTFPLMSAGLIRGYPGNSGGTIAMLYFTNSLGAAAGVLASGFVLIARVGLPGTLLTAGLLNIVLALVVWMLARNVTQALPAPVRADAGRGDAGGYALMLTVAALTGAASFIYEIGWIRMLSMVLGSSTHAFELMLSAFILGLAFGGLWIKRRIDQTTHPERFLGIVQVAMGLLALATLVVYGRTFELMQWLLAALARSDAGYAVFNLGSHLIALAVMFPAAFCAGMTLPLITHALLRRGTGERAIGAVYAANTVGAIAGVFFAVHVGMPLLGLKGLILAGGAIDIALGLVLLWRISGGGRLATYATAAGLAAVSAVLAFVHLDPYKMASGVYRHGALLARDQAQILFHQDGKTATVNLVRTPSRVSIHTNGKSDAALNPDPKGPAASDETTMVLTGALPLALHPQARTVASIGLGSGLTSHVLLASDAIREVDTIEIESAMVDAARGFSPRNDNVYRDPRSRVHVEDAKTFFSTHNKRYDIIASEPSNPWVSGVASLFTEEFYRHVKRYLAKDGLFVQWMQLYEVNTTLVASVIKALSREFADYVIYLPNDIDLIIVAKRDGPLGPASSEIFQQPRLARELARINVLSLADLELHRVGGRKVLQPYFETFPIAANSDFFPVLDLNAAKARFMGGYSVDIVDLTLAPIPALEMLDGVSARSGAAVSAQPWLKRSRYAQQALAGREYLLEGAADKLARIPAALRGDFELTRVLLVECLRPQGIVSLDPLFAVADAMLPFLTPEELRAVWGKLKAAPCSARLDPPQRAWIELFAAIGERDANETARIAGSLLGLGDGAGAGRADYLLAAAITGHLARDEREQATALWRRLEAQAPAEPRGALRELLRGHLFQQSRREATAGMGDVRK
ncbi:MAG: spermidine synthase [Betaproteobacteria bacterium]|nr:spermidine synthase [Betaproteobacteria bacterium]